MGATEGVVGLLLGVFLVALLVIAIVRFVTDVRRHDPDMTPTDTTIDMATGEVAGQGIVAVIMAFLERLF